MTQLDQILDNNLAQFKAAQISTVEREIHTCPDCDQEIRLIKPKQGKQFWGHVDYQNNQCQTYFGNKGGKPVKREALPTSNDYPCPTCGEGHLQRKPAKKKDNFFWGCSNWKNGCKHIAWDERVNRRRSK